MAELSERGFEQYGEIETTYGHTIRVYESSSAEGPHVWINTKLTDKRVAPREGHTETTAHLSLPQAMALRAHLDEFIEGVPKRWEGGAKFLEDAHRQIQGEKTEAPESPQEDFLDRLRAIVPPGVPDERVRGVARLLADLWQIPYDRDEQPEHPLWTKAAEVAGPGASRRSVAQTAAALAAHEWFTEETPPSGPEDDSISESGENR